MDTKALIRRAEALLLQKKVQADREPSEEFKSCLQLYSMCVKIMFDCIPDYEDFPSKEELMACAEYRYVASMGGIEALCGRLRDKVANSNISEEEQQECLELIGSSERLYNAQIGV
jgi:hypothetical protein